MTKKQREEEILKRLQARGLDVKNVTLHYTSEKLDEDTEVEEEKTDE